MPTDAEHAAVLRHALDVVYSLRLDERAAIERAIEAFAERDAALAECERLTGAAIDLSTENKHLRQAIEMHEAMRSRSYPIR